MSSGGTTGSPAWKGLDTSRMPVFIGYDQVERMIAALLPTAASWRPDEVVGIARGGVVPAAMAAGILALPLSFVAHDKASGAVTWIGPVASGRRILLVDDCCSSGNTLHRARLSLCAEGRECMTLVVVHDPDTIRHTPDLSLSDARAFPAALGTGRGNADWPGCESSRHQHRFSRGGAVRRFGLG